MVNGVGISSSVFYLMRYYFVLRLSNPPLVFRMILRVGRQILVKDFLFTRLMECLPTKEWLLLNLTLPGKFGVTASHWATFFPYILWNLWKRRNDAVFQVHSMYRDFVYDHGLRMVEMGLRDNGRLRLSGVELSTEDKNVVWCKPLHGWCELNSDGAVCRNSKMVSCYGVLRDADGCWLMGYSKRLDVCSNLDSEL
ncbi:hypothetical protein V6N11_022846 [Hibiscus sabdariffa]|uniref:Uncharacterized protein n=1 Tax=Hibiscus sabdariffa TaxID=183260 RepID=A0ABR2TKG6_9ROSI